MSVAYLHNRLRGMKNLIGMRKHIIDQLLQEKCYEIKVYASIDSSMKRVGFPIHHVHLVLNRLDASLTYFTYFELPSHPHYTHTAICLLDSNKVVYIKWKESIVNDHFSVLYMGPFQMQFNEL